MNIRLSIGQIAMKPIITTVAAAAAAKTRITLNCINQNNK
jgi:hypothetical protein